MAGVTVGGVRELFHPAVAAWFAGRFPAGPTAPQEAGWREIAAGRHTLISAPTGSGKTLAAFLVCVDRLYRAHEASATAAGEAVASQTVARNVAGNRGGGDRGGGDRGGGDRGGGDRGRRNRGPRDRGPRDRGGRSPRG